MASYPRSQPLASRLRAMYLTLVGCFLVSITRRSLFCNSRAFNYNLKKQSHFLALSFYKLSKIFSYVLFWKYFLQNVLMFQICFHFVYSYRRLYIFSKIRKVDNKLYLFFFNFFFKCLFSILLALKNQEVFEICFYCFILCPYSLHSYLYHSSSFLRPTVFFCCDFSLFW